MTNESSPTGSRPPRKALGRGLNALLGNRPAEAAPAPGTETAAAGRVLRQIPIELVQPNPDQPRKRFTPESLEELADSIKTHGVLQPVIVTPAPDSRPGDPNARYVLIAGERRWRAAQLAGLTLIPAIVQRSEPDKSLELALIENLQREDLNPIEAAQAFERLSTDFGMNHEEIAARTGKQRSSITNFLRLLKLPPEVQQMLANRQLSMGHARAVLALPPGNIQIQIAARSIIEGMSVRQIEKLATELAKPQKAPKKKEEEPKAEAALDANTRAALRDLEAALGTRVRLQGSVEKGALVIEYYSEEDLMRIYDVITNAGSKLD